MKANRMNLADTLNLQCMCRTLDPQRLREQFDKAPGLRGFTSTLATTHPHLFSQTAVFLDPEVRNTLAHSIAAIERVVALPAYQDYMVRAKLSEVVVAGDACKNSVVEFYEGQGALPPNLTSAGCNNNKTKYIADTKVAGGNITVTTTALPDLGTAAGKVYGLKPTPHAGNTDVLDWACNTSAGTTIDEKYLPSLCR